ncbi:hypothetical protein [Ruminococcus sp.]|uniref:hypothetical protein n=1 Tax=Ruminococcus sp. TaxID=41978 RepID=UPI0025EFE829|nr:hypothetical protein [Ruminococcus sp.]MBQ9541560.1 hypothetical protein [Ruminococcus sp.]
MKVLKRIGLCVLALPFVLVCLYIIIEIVGACVNHISTDRQTSKLKTTLTTAVTDAEITDEYSWTGNTGNGNHVDCVSEVTFSSGLDENDIEKALKQNYDSFQLTVKENGDYTLRVVTLAPFWDNIEGH